jgi:type II secretory pathway pseudopilin PulG
VLIIVGGLFMVLVIGTAIAVPVFMSAREDAQKRTCQSNLRTVDSAIMMYVAESPEELYPESLEDLVDAEVMMSIPTCPAGDKPYEWVEPGIGQTPYISCPNKADHTI